MAKDTEGLGCAVVIGLLVWGVVGLLTFGASAIGGGGSSGWENVCGLAAVAAFFVPAPVSANAERGSNGALVWTIVWAPLLWLLGAILVPFISMWSGLGDAKAAVIFLCFWLAIGTFNWYAFRPDPVKPPVETHRSKAANALGMSPLALAVVRNEADQVRQLLAEGADPLQPDLKGRTAVDLARQLGRKDLLALMMRGRTQMLHNTCE